MSIFPCLVAILGDHQPRRHHHLLFDEGMKRLLYQNESIWNNAPIDNNQVAMMQHMEIGILSIDVDDCVDSTNRNESETQCNYIWEFYSQWVDTIAKPLREILTKRAT